MTECRLLTAPRGPGGGTGKWTLQSAPSLRRPEFWWASFSTTRFPPIEQIVDLHSLPRWRCRAFHPRRGIRREALLARQASPRIQQNVNNWLNTRPADASARTQRGRGYRGPPLGRAEPRNTRTLSSGPEDQPRGPSPHCKAAESGEIATLRSGPEDKPQGPAPRRAPGGNLVVMQRAKAPSETFRPPSKKAEGRCAPPLSPPPGERA